MILNSISKPLHPIIQRFKPGKWLWLFTGLFLPLFLSLGVWQLNRAVEKEQMLAERDGGVVSTKDLDFSALPLYRESTLTGQFVDDETILLDNKTWEGQFGYEVFKVLQTSQGRILISLGWVAGSADRRELPTLVTPRGIMNQTVMFRPAPVNPVFDAETNEHHPADERVWIAQSITLDWLKNIGIAPVAGFAQLLDAEVAGVGPVVWQPTVMSPTKHRGYAVQWFCMAAALFGMFLYAGFKHQNRNV